MNRRETLADLARSLPWSKQTTDTGTDNCATYTTTTARKRRESSADSGIKSMRSRRDSHASELAKLWNKKEAATTSDKEKEDTGTSTDCTRNVIIK